MPVQYGFKQAKFTEPKKCPRCLQMLGLANDSIQRLYLAADYLEINRSASRNFGLGREKKRL